MSKLSQFLGLGSQTPQPTTGDVVAEQRRAKRALRRCLKLSPLLAVVAVVGYAASGDLQGGSTFLSVFAVSIAAAAAAMLTGALLGFLFGLPRTVGQPNPKARLATNTNLDQISDWLTKILVGLGLVQLGKVTHGVSRIAASLVPGLGGGAGAKAFAVALLVYSAADGFLVGYIWTRVDLSKRFREAADDLDQTEQVLQAPVPGSLQPPPS